MSASIDKSACNKGLEENASRLEEVEVINELYSSAEVFNEGTTVGITREKLAEEMEEAACNIGVTVEVAFDEEASEFKVISPELKVETASVVNTSGCKVPPCTSFSNTFGTRALDVSVSVSILPTTVVDLSVVVVVVTDISMS